MAGSRFRLREQIIFTHFPLEILDIQNFGLKPAINCVFQNHKMSKQFREHLSRVKLLRGITARPLGRDESKKVKEKYGQIKWI